MNPQNLIRQATLDEVYSIAQVLMVVQKLHADAVPELFKQPTSPAQFVNEIQLLIRDPSHIYLVAEDEGRIIGYLLLEVVRRPETAIQYARAWLHIHQIAVDPAYQQHGWGTHLLKQAKQLAQEMGLSRVSLETWQFNTKAQSFFRRQGFSTFSQRMWTEIEVAIEAKEQ